MKDETKEDRSSSIILLPGHWSMLRVAKLLHCFAPRYVQCAAQECGNTFRVGDPNRVNRALHGVFRLFGLELRRTREMTRQLELDIRTLEAVDGGESSQVTDASLMTQSGDQVHRQMKQLYLDYPRQSNPGWIASLVGRSADSVSYSCAASARCLNFVITLRWVRVFLPLADCSCARISLSKSSA